jgi:hypothetical protein
MRPRRTALVTHSDTDATVSRVPACRPLAGRVERSTMLFAGLVATSMVESHEDCRRADNRRRVVRESSSLRVRNPRGRGSLVIGAPGRLVGTDAAMRLHLHRPAAPRQTSVADGHDDERSLAEQWLDPCHPLARSLGRSETACEQLVTVTAIQAAGVVWLLGGWRFGMALAIGAGVAQLLLACRVAMLRSLRRDLCLELVAGGGARLPLPCIERTCARLLDRRALERLANSIDDLVRTAHSRSPSPLANRPLAERRVIRAVGPQLCEVASLLRSGPAVRGVALVEWLLTSPASPLYGSDVEALRQELRRARYHLAPE